MKKYFKLILKVVISAVLLYLIFKGVDKNLLVSNLSRINFRYAPLIIALLAANYFFSSVRWKNLLTVHKKTSKISVWYLTSLYFIGSFFNNFMPTSIGGDVYKMFKLGKKIDSMSNAFSATFMERFTGVLALVLISIFSIYKYLGLGTLLILIWLALGMFIGMKLLKFLGKKSEKFKKVYDAFAAYKGQWKVLGFAFGTSFVVQLASIFTQYFIYLSLGANIPVVYSLLVFPLIILATFFIPSINGVGVQDTLYMQMFKVVGIAPEISLSASILFHFFRLGVSMFGGVLYALGKDE